MRKYKINRTKDVKLPSKEAITRHKDFGRLWQEYDRYTKPPKKPIYRDKKLFFFLLIIALLALILSQIAREDEEKKKGNGTEQNDH